MKQKIGIVSLGCPRNLVDSEDILGRITRKGYSVVDIRRADIALVNTCSFIEDAKRESIDVLLDLIDLKKEGRLKKIIVYGCLAERYRGQLQRELPEIDAFVGCVSLNRSSDRFAISVPHYAYVKICEGCIDNCSFCIIPRIKGTFRSLDMQSVLNKVNCLDKAGVAEINIIGQDTSSYGMDLYGEPRLTELVKKVVESVRHAGWVRLLYLNPLRITDELLGAIADSGKVCKYIDVPIQHINNRILKLMNRKTRRSQIIALIKKIRERIPQVALRTSIMVGFPSETDKEFKELLTFIEEMQFERLGAFIYSKEEGTAAYRYGNQIPKLVKIERFNAVMASQQKISRQINRQFLGKAMEVLIDEKEKDVYLGRSQYDAPEVDGSVYVHSKRTLAPGEFVKVRITDTLEYDLVGEASTDEYRLK